MKIFAVGLDFKSAPLELRAKATCREKDFARGIAPDAQEYVWLSTCNRVDIFAVGDVVPDSVLSRWVDRLGLSDQERKCFHIYEEEAALNYLFRVSSSLESMVVGEVQITGQLKRAYDESIKGGHVGPILHRCFQKAFKLNKRIRSQTEVGRLAVSMPSVAVKLAERILGSLTPRTIGVIGLGEIGRVAAEHFASVQPRKLLLYNRTVQVAEELAEKLKKESVNVAVVSSVDSLLNESDVIVSAADAVVVSSAQLQKLDKKSRDKFLVDLSVPPSIEIEDRSRQHLFIYSVDDLKKIADENNQLRQHEMQKANALVDDELASCWRAVQAMRISEGGLQAVIQSLSSKADQLTQSELDELRRRLPDLSPQQWEEIEKMARRLSSKLLQDPMGELRLKMESQEEPESWMKFFKELFRID